MKVKLLLFVSLDKLKICCFADIRMAFLQSHWIDAHHRRQASSGEQTKQQGKERLEVLMWSPT